MINNRFFYLLLFLITLSGCSDESVSPQTTSGETSEIFEKNLQKQFLMARSGDVISIPAGRHLMTRPLSLKIDGVTIRGAGMDKTILDFSNQVAGAEAMLVSASQFTIEDLAIENAAGDALKVNEGSHIVIRRVRTEWTNGPDTENGAYGIYPVQTSHTLIEESVAIGASDAGIYVGQSRHVIVRNNRAEYNVAGIEIENTVHADVYDNEARHNTGGILVFNMPDLPITGSKTRVYNNRIEANNTDNFAPPGGAVANVPAGTGILVNANDEVEIFANQLSHNRTANIIISSGFSSNLASEAVASVYDPYPESIWIYQNSYEGGGDSPDTLELKALKTAVYGLNGRFPDVIWDGFVNPELLDQGILPADKQICVTNPVVLMLNVDAPNDYASPGEDMSHHRCELTPLPPVSLENIPAQPSL